MAIATQGTYLYAIDPDDESIINVACITSLDGVDVTNEQIETTCLQALVRTYQAGLGTPGQASFGLNFDTTEATHTRLFALKKAGTTLNWAIGFSDGTADPTVDTGGTFDLPTTRSFIRFQGFMTNFPFNFAQNSVIQTTVSIQISGDPELHAKA
jgi:hypothetical protein